MRKLDIFTFLIFIVLLMIFIACPTEPPDDEDKPNPYPIVEGGYPNWSPTGERLAFVRNDSLYLYYFENEEIESVTYPATEPSFAPDGVNLAFERDQKIYTLELETNEERYLAEGITPSWSENGKWIAFAHKEATRVLTDGTRIWGNPSPDSSLYYYDLEGDSIVRVIVTNYDSLWIGEQLSMAHPEWAVHDSILIFSTEQELWKVHRWGGKAIRDWLDFDNENAGLKKQIEVEIDIGQQDWNQFQQRVAIHYVIDQRPFGDVVKKVLLSRLRPGLTIGLGGYFTDPTWSPYGTKIAVRKDNNGWIVIFDLINNEYIIKP